MSKSLNETNIDTDRMERWKCPFCGSHDKEIAVLKDESNEPYATVLVCHNCGKVDYFAKSIIFAKKIFELDDMIVQSLNSQVESTGVEIESNGMLNIDMSKYSRT